MLPKVSGYVKSYDGENLYFWIQDDDLLEKYNIIWLKVNAVKKEFDSEPVYNKKFLRTKIKSYSDEARDFHDREMRRAGSNHTCLAVVSIGSTLKKDEKIQNFFPISLMNESGEE